MARRRLISPAKSLKLALSPSVLIRFLSKIEHCKLTGCWLWTACQDHKGYGQIKIDGRALWAHRVSYAVFKRTIPDAIEIDHKCRNHACCNPHHLRTKTKSGNSSDGARRRWEEAAPF